MMAQAPNISAAKLHTLGRGAKVDGLETSPPLSTSASLGGQAPSRACSGVSMALSQKQYACFQEEVTHTELGVSAMLLKVLLRRISC